MNNDFLNDEDDPAILNSDKVPASQKKVTPGAIQTRTGPRQAGGVGSGKKNLFETARMNAFLYPEVAAQARRDLARPQPSDVPLAMPQQFPNVEETNGKHVPAAQSVEMDQKGALMSKAACMKGFYDEFMKIGGAMDVVKKIAPVAAGVAGGAAVAHSMGEKKRKRQLSSFVSEARRLNQIENAQLARTFYSAGVRAGRGPGGTK